VSNLVNGMRGIVRAAIGTVATTYIDAAGALLESDRLPPDDHRPWPVRATPWAMAQTWTDVLLLHWRAAPAIVKRLLPRGLRLDTIEGTAWIGITAFRVTGARLRGAPAVPGVSDFAEVNVRTYVTVDDKPGVFFLSLDAASAISLLGGRAWYALPYFFANATIRIRAGAVDFSSVRQQAGAPAATFVVKYRSAGPVPTARRGLVRWFTERYCLYTFDGVRLARAEIHHKPWPVQWAKAVIKRNTLIAAAGVPVATAVPAIVHYAAGVEAIVWPPTPLRTITPRRTPQRNSAKSTADEKRQRAS
jgi:uncharacterized protein